jgi:hypothetical protein
MGLLSILCYTYIIALTPNPRTPPLLTPPGGGGSGGSGGKEGGKDRQLTNEFYEPLLYLYNL